MNERKEKTANLKSSRRVVPDEFLAEAGGRTWDLLLIK
jgi:hypothetical protein